MYKCPATPIRTTRALFLAAYIYQFEPTSVVIGYLWMFIDILKLCSIKVMASPVCTVPRIGGRGST